MKFATARNSCLAVLFAAFTASAGSAAAQEAAPTSDGAAESSIGLELNAVEPTQGGCRLTFVVSNKLGGDLSKAAYEVALFDKEGRVDRLTVLDFQALPKGKTKVRQFDLANTDCDGLGRVLINDATACKGEGVEPGACIGKLETETKTDLDFGT